MGYVLASVPVDFAFQKIERHEVDSEYGSCLKKVVIRQRSMNGNLETVKAFEVHKSFMVTFRYTLVYIHDPLSHRISWTLDTTAQNDVTTMSGYWDFREEGKDSVLLAYRLSGASMRAVPKVVQNYFTQVSLQKFLGKVRKRLEREAIANSIGR